MDEAAQAQAQAAQQSAEAVGAEQRSSTADGGVKFVGQVGVELEGMSLWVWMAQFVGQVGVKLGAKVCGAADGGVKFLGQMGVGGLDGTNSASMNTLTREH